MAGCETSLGRRLAIVALGLAFAGASAGAALAQSGDERHQRVKPYRIIGNIYYVGFAGVGVYLITSPAGHVILDSGYPETAATLRENIEQAGFKLRDIKYIINSHTHSDHVGGNALLKEQTGAKILISVADRPVLADGGRSDFRGDGSEQWQPIEADGVVEQGTEVKVGTVVLKAHLTPGHTKGNTTWTTTVQEGGKTYQACFVASTRLNPGVPLVDNPKYPGVIEDYAKSFAVLKALTCDVFISSHPQYADMDRKRDRLQQGASPNAFIDPDGYRTYLKGSEEAYLAQLAKERGGRPQAAAAGAPLPPDVDPETRSRLPRPRPEELDDAGRKLLASIREGGDSAPRTIRLNSPKVGEYMTAGNQYLRYESGLDPKLREIAIMLAARAMDQQYEWTAHELAGREAGLPQAIIDIIKRGEPVTGVTDEKQATLIQLGREALYDHRVTPETYARALKLFGKKGLVDVVSLMGHYTATAILLTVFDQHVAADQQPLLTPLRLPAPPPR